MIISTCGFGSTGSSAVADYLLECDGIQVFDNVEFMVATDPDGLEDLEFQIMKHHTRILSSKYAIQRFCDMIKRHEKEWTANTPITKEEIEALTKRFIDNISQICFCGFKPATDQHIKQLFIRYFGYSVFLNRIIRPLEKKHIIRHNRDYFPFGKVYAAIAPENFYEESRNYIRELLEKMGCDYRKNIVLDQAFTGCDPAKSFPFFDDPYAIVVDRDPRDLYIFAREVLLSRGRFMPTESVKEYVKYYKMLRENMPYKTPNDRILVISFESMVYDYENTTEKLNAFLGLKNNNRRTVFVPEVSVANTNLIRKFPEYMDDVKYIEDMLGDYLFPFEKYKDMDNKGEMFFGKSPLNNQ